MNFYIERSSKFSPQKKLTGKTPKPFNIVTAIKSKTFGLYSVSAIKNTSFSMKGTSKN
jgi:hypothetical protein